MANSEYPDTLDFTAHRAGQPPIVLAQLPRVGAPPAVANPAPSQAVPPPVQVPQLELRDQIEQRTQLHIADTPVNDMPSTSHFVDRQHHLDREPTPSLEPTTRPPSPPPAPQPVARQQAEAAKPQTLSEKLFRLHAKLEPHAGLIVALALIASAGLLYWMIVAPTQLPAPSYENYSQELGHEGFGTTSHTMPDHTMPDHAMPDNYVPEFAGPEFVAALPQPAEPVSLPEQWTEVPLPTPQQAAAPPQLEQPDFDPPVLRELPSTDEPHFPTTSHPHALDFSKSGPTLPGNSTDLPLPLPEVARRPTTTLNR